MVKHCPILIVSGKLSMLTQRAKISAKAGRLVYVQAQ